MAERERAILTNQDGCEDHRDHQRVLQGHNDDCDCSSIGYNHALVSIFGKFLPNQS